MAEDQFDNGSEEEYNSGNQEEQQWLKDLRKEAKEARRLRTENEGYKRRNELREAGLNLNERQMKALLAAHDGEANPEEYRKTAEELGFVQKEAEVDPEVQRKTEEVANASQGAKTVTERDSDEDPYADAKTPADVMRIANERGTAITY